MMWFKEGFFHLIFHWQKVNHGVMSSSEFNFHVCQGIGISIPVWYLGMWLEINLAFNNKLEGRDNTFDSQSFYPFIKIQRMNDTRTFFPIISGEWEYPVLIHWFLQHLSIHPSISSFFSGHPQAVAAEASKDWGPSVGNFADLLRWSAENVDLSSLAYSAPSPYAHALSIREKP